MEISYRLIDLVRKPVTGALRRFSVAYLYLPLTSSIDEQKDNHLLSNMRSSSRTGEICAFWKGVHRSAKLILHQIQWRPHHFDKWQSSAHISA